MKLFPSPLIKYHFFHPQHEIIYSLWQNGRDISPWYQSFESPCQSKSIKEDTEKSAFIWWTLLACISHLESLSKRLISLSICKWLLLSGHTAFRLHVASGWCSLERQPCWSAESNVIGVESCVWAKNYSIKGMLQ